MKRYFQIALALLIQAAVVCSLGLGLFLALSCLRWFPWFEQDIYGPMSGLLNIASPLAGLSGLSALIFRRRLGLSPVIPAAGLLPHIFVAAMYHASRTLNRFPPAGFPAEPILAAVFATGFFLATVFALKFMINCVPKKEGTSNTASV